MLLSLEELVDWRGVQFAIAIVELRFSCVISWHHVVCATVPQLAVIVASPMLPERSALEQKCCVVVIEQLPWLIHPSLCSDCRVPGICQLKFHPCTRHRSKRMWLHHLLSQLWSGLGRVVGLIAASSSGCPADPHEALPGWHGPAPRLHRQNFRSNAVCE